MIFRIMPVSFSSSQSGIAGPSALAGLLAVILLSALALDVLTVYSLRVRLQHALLHAARQASLHHAQPERIARTFAQVLQAARTPRQDHWQIRILSPSSAAFQKHGQLKPPHHPRRVISQGWQAQQHKRNPSASPSIFQANTLHLQLHYVHQPAPFSALRLLPALVLAAGSPLAPRGLRITLDIQHPMQSDPILWEDMADGRVVYSAGAPSNAGSSAAASPGAPVPQPSLPTPHPESAPHALPPAPSADTPDHAPSAPTPQAQPAQTPLPELCT